MIFEINIDDVPEDEREQVEDIIDNLFMECSLNEEMIEELQEKAIEEINEILYG